MFVMLGHVPGLSLWTVISYRAPHLCTANKQTHHGYDEKSKRYRKHKWMQRCGQGSAFMRKTSRWLRQLRRFDTFDGVE